MHFSCFFFFPLLNKTMFLEGSVETKHFYDELREQFCMCARNKQQEECVRVSSLGLLSYVNPNLFPHPSLCQHWEGAPYNRVLEVTDFELKESIFQPNLFLLSLHYWLSVISARFPAQNPVTRNTIEADEQLLNSLNTHPSTLSIVNKTFLWTFQVSCCSHAHSHTCSTAPLNEFLSSLHGKLIHLWKKHLH